MTGTVDDLIGEARATIGTSESPAGSNKQPFAAEVGHLNGRPWCATWTVAMAKRAGVLLPPGVAETAYTPSAVNAWKIAGRWFDEPEAGDFVYFQFDGDPQVDHVEIVEGVTVSGDVRTIGGNTSSTSVGSQSNGGGVYERIRSRRSIVGFGRPYFFTPPNAAEGDDMPWTETDSTNLAAIRAALESINHHIAGKAEDGARLPRALRALDTIRQDVKAVAGAHGVED